MTLSELRKRQGEPSAEHGDGEHTEHHPSALEYVQIGSILAVITAVEVGLYYVDMSYTLLVTALMGLSVTKFTLVVLWFMHLKFDNRLFGGLFATGLVGTLILFAVVIALQHGKFV